MEFVFKKLPKKEPPGQDGLIVEFYQISIIHLKDELTHILHNLFQKIKEEGPLLNSFYEVSINIIPTPDKDITKKETPYQYLSISKDTE